MVDIIQMQLTGLPIDRNEVLKVEKEMQAASDKAMADMKSCFILQSFVYELNVDWVAKRNEKLKVKVLGLIENMSYFVEKDGEKNHIFGKSSLKEFAEERDIDLIGQIEIIKELGDNSQDKDCQATDTSCKT